MNLATGRHVRCLEQIAGMATEICAPIPPFALIALGCNEESIQAGSSQTFSCMDEAEVEC